MDFYCTAATIYVCLGVNAGMFSTPSMWKKFQNVEVRPLRTWLVLHKGTSMLHADVPVTDL